MSSEKIAAAEEQVKKTNPLLNRKSKMPGETYRLPSGGELYKDGELDDEVVNGEVVVYPLTTIDEIYMRSPDMLFQGTAIEKVFKRCIPQVKQPLELFSNDVDFLLTALRKVSNGNIITITHKCEACGDKAKKHDYDIPLSHFLQTAKTINEDFVKGLNFKLESGEKIQLRPSRMSEMLEIYRMNEDEVTTPEEIQEIMFANLSSTIRSVDGITDKDMIIEWLESLSVGEIQDFIDHIEGVNKWGATFKYTITCEDCEKEEEISTVLNPLYFFTLPSSRKTPKK